MPVENKIQTEQDIQQQNQSQEERAVNLLDSLKDHQIEGEVKEQLEEEVQEVEETDEVDSQEETEEEPEEELIPRSKVQARIDKLTNELKQLKEAQKQPETPKDDTTDQLERMSERELKDLKRQVRSAQLKSSSDEVALNKLLDLEERIDDTIRTAPQKFATKQQEAYNRAAEEIATDESFGDINKVAPQILEIAKEIYSNEPELQKTIQGQAIALKLAAKHFKAVNNLRQSSSENKALKSQVNTFKKKTALDSKVMKGSLEKGQLDSLRTQAFKGGTLRDKTNYIKSDPRFKISEMLPDFKIG